jgi:hypothetical protein
MYKDVYNQVNNVGAAATYAKLLGVRKILVDNLTPMDKTATMTLNTQDNVDLVDAMKGLFQPSQIIAEQMRDGSLGKTAGFEFFENTLLVKHTSGTDANGYTVNGANQTGAAVTVQTGAGTFKKGDILTFAGCNRVHPETKADTGALQQFVVTADYAGGAGNVSITPSIVDDRRHPERRSLANQRRRGDEGRRQRCGLRHLARLPQGRLRLRDGGPGDAQGRALRRPRGDGRDLAADREPVRHRERQVPGARRCPLRLQDHPGAARQPLREQLSTRR